MALNRGLKKTDATYIEIGHIVRSKAGRKAAIEAARNNLPALCGVDAVLRQKL